MNDDRKKIAPGFYLMSCIEDCAYDDCFFWWEKGNQYRMQIKEDGNVIIEATGNIFVSTPERLDELLNCFKIEEDINNNVDVVKFFFDKGKSE